MRPWWADNGGGGAAGEGGEGGIEGKGGDGRERAADAEENSLEKETQGQSIGAQLSSMHRLFWKQWTVWGNHRGIRAPPGPADTSGYLFA